MACDLLLISPKDIGSGFKDIPPLGMLCIAGFLENVGFKVKVIDLAVEKVGANFEKINSLLKDEAPLLVGIGGTTHSRFECFKIAGFIKKINPNLKIAYGGVHASFTAEESLKYISDIDYVVRGEGEETVLELMKALSGRQQSDAFSTIPGLSYRKDGRILHNPDRRFIRDLDSLPLPARHLINMNRYDMKLEHIKAKGTAVITSRGCPYNCNFCSASAMFGHTIRTRNPVNVIKEIELLLSEYRLNGIRIFDSTFTAVRTHVQKFCEEIAHRNLKFPWECEIRVDTVDEELLTLMKRTGCYYVDIGVESGSQKVLDLMNKRITIEGAQKCLDLCYKLGILTKVFFSFGHIGENLDDVDKTFKFIEINRKKITTLACGAGVRIYPGTPLEKYARENGYLPGNFSWSLPYKEKKWELIGQSPFVPIFIDNLSVNDLIGIRHRIIKEKFTGWQGVKKAIISLFQPEQWKKGVLVVKGKLKGK